MRTLCNALLQHHPAVALLEADCGQPQFGPAGLVSVTTVRAPLLLPTPLLLEQPHDSFLVGDTSPQNNPLTYLNGIRKLHQLHLARTAQGTPPLRSTSLIHAAARHAPHAHHPVCASARALWPVIPLASRSDHGASPPAWAARQGGGSCVVTGEHTACSNGHNRRARAGESVIPLVVNTMGWVKGFGLSLLRDVLLSVQPRRVVALQSGNPVRDLPEGTDWIGEGAVLRHLHSCPSSQRGVHAGCCGCPRIPTERVQCDSFRCCDTSSGAVMRHGRGSGGARLTGGSEFAARCAGAAATAGVCAEVEGCSHHSLPGIAMASAQPGGAAAVAPKAQAHSATEERAARLHAWALATLHARGGGPPTRAALVERAFSGRLAQTAAELCACRPVAVDLAHVLTVPMFEDWGDAPAGAVLNGALVGLLRCDPSQPRGALRVRPAAPVSSRHARHVPSHRHRISACLSNRQTHWQTACIVSGHAAQQSRAYCSPLLRLRACMVSVTVWQLREAGQRWSRVLRRWPRERTAPTPLSTLAALPHPAATAGVCAPA